MPEASPVASSTLRVAGNCPRPRCMVAISLSNALTKPASGACAANTRGLPLTLTVPPSSAIALIRLTPPTVLRNWLGGLTWNGCTASARV